MWISDVKFPTSALKWTFLEHAWWKGVTLGIENTTNSPTLGWPRIYIKPRLGYKVTMRPEKCMWIINLVNFWDPSKRIYTWGMRVGCHFFFAKDWQPDLQIHSFKFSENEWVSSCSRSQGPQHRLLFNKLTRFLLTTQPERGAWPSPVPEKCTTALPRQPERTKEPCLWWSQNGKKGPQRLDNESIGGWKHNKLPGHLWTRSPWILWDLTSAIQGCQVPGPPSLSMRSWMVTRAPVSSVISNVA